MYKHIFITCIYAYINIFIDFFISILIFKCLLRVKRFLRTSTAFALQLAYAYEYLFVGKASFTEMS